MADLPEEDNPNAFGDQEVETENIVQEPVAQQPQQPQVPQSEAFSPWEEYKNDPNYAGLSIAQKQNLFDEWQNYATQYLAQQGALETEEDIQYTKDYFTDLAKTENFRKPIFVAPDYGEQILQQATSGFEGVTAGAVGYASAIGLADTQAAANLIAEKYRNRRDMYINPDLRKFGEKEMGFFEAGATIITNPWDVAAPLLAQSMGSNAPSFVAGAGGAAIGAAIAGPPGAVTGGMIGGMALSGPVDAAATFNELTISEVIARGLDPANPKDVQTVLDDPKFKEDTVAYSTARGAVITAAELATLGAGKYIAAAAKLKTAGVGKKILTGTGIAAVETVGEGAGELGAQIAGPVAAGKPVKVEPKEIAAEMFVETPGSVAIGTLQTVGELLKVQAPSTASEVMRDAVKAAAEGRYGAVLGEQPTVEGPETYYNSLSIADKARVLGLAPNAVLTMEQGTFSTLGEEEKAKVQADFDATQSKKAEATVEKAEAEARAAFNPPKEEAPTTEAKTPEPAPTAAPEAPAPAEPTTVAPAPTEPAAPVEPSATKPLTEAPTAPLAAVAPATAREAAKTEQAPAPAPAAEGPTGVEIGDQFQKNTTRLSELNKKEQQESLTPEEKKERTELTKANRALGQELQRRDQQQLPREAKAPFTMPTIPTPAVPIPTPTAAAPAPAQKPAPAPAVKKLKPTKKQATDLAKLGYLPADIEGLDRNQAKDIIAKQTPKTPVGEAPKETPPAPVPTGAAPAPVAPATVVPPAPTAPAQPTAGEAGGPVAPTEGQPAAPQTEQQRLDEAEKKLQEKVGQVVAEADKLGIDEESVKTWLGPNPSDEKILRTRAVLRLLNLAVNDVYNNLRKRATKGRAKQAELIGELGAKIRKIILTTREEGAGVLTDPEDMNNLETIYVNPDRLLSRLRSDLTTDAADFFVKMMEEELLHLQHGRAALELFVALTPEAETTPENFRKFFRRQSEEIENSLSLSQIQEVVGKYAGIDTAGKTKEQLIQEFAEATGRRGRLGEEYLRTLIQRRLLGDITEDKIRDLTPNPVLRSLGMIRNWLFEFIGETIPKKIADQTPVERYFNAVNDLIYGNKMSTVREARDEKNTALPGKETLSASIDPKAIRRRLEQKAYQAELVRKVNEDFGLGQPKGAQKGELWAKTVGKFISKFPSFTPDEITSIVGAEIPNAVKFFDPDRGILFSTYLYQRGYYAMQDELTQQVRRRRESGRIDVPGSVERERFRPVSELYKKVKPEEVTKVAKEDEIAAELESIENAADEEATRVVAEQADEVEQAYSQVQAGRPEEDQTFEELLGEKAPSTELVAAGVSPVQAAIQSDLQKVFDSLFSTFTPVEQDVFDFLFRAKEMENPPTRKGIMEKYNIPHSRQYDSIVESVREKTADILAENNIFSSAQLTASVDPFEVAKRKAVRTAVTALSNRYGFPVAFTTSDRVPVDQVKFASAMSKIQSLKLNPDPVLFNFLHSFENKLDWGRIKSAQDLQVAAENLYESLKQSPVNTLAVGDLDWARVETDLQTISNSDAEAGFVLAEYNRDPGIEGQLAVLNYINDKRKESVSEWSSFLEKNEDSMFMRALAWSIPNTALKQNKIGKSTVALHPGAYRTLRQNILENGLKPVGIEKEYRKIMADIAKRGLDTILIVSPTEQWVFIPGQEKDPENFEANIQKLKYLSAITWCTGQSEDMGRRYLTRGDFWVFLRDNLGTLTVRTERDRVAEIQGPSNLGPTSISDELLEKLNQFKRIRPELAEGIDSKIKGSGRKTKEQLQEYIDSPSDPLSGLSRDSVLALVLNQGAMTPEQKNIFLDQYDRGVREEFGEIIKRYSTQDLSQRDVQNELSAKLDSFFVELFGDQFKVAASVASPESEFLLKRSFDLVRGLLFDPSVTPFRQKLGPSLSELGYSGYVISRYLDSQKISQAEKDVFTSFLADELDYFPIAASPKMFKSKEEASSVVNTLIGTLFGGVVTDYKSLRSAKATLQSLINNPIFDSKDIFGFLETYKDKIILLQDKPLSRYTFSNRISEYWELVQSKLIDPSKLTRNSPAYSFFIPKKDLRKISKADRISYFDKFMEGQERTKLFEEEFLDRPVYINLNELAEILVGLGDRAKKFITDAAIAHTVRLALSERQSPLEDELNYIAQHMAPEGEQRAYIRDIVDKALPKVLSSYNQDTEEMPERVSDWMTVFIGSRSASLSSLVTAFKAFRKNYELVKGQPKDYFKSLSSDSEIKLAAVNKIFSAINYNLLKYPDTQKKDLNAAWEDYISILSDIPDQKLVIDSLNTVLYKITDKLAEEGIGPIQSYLGNGIKEKIIKFLSETLNRAVDSSKDPNSATTRQEELNFRAENNSVLAYYIRATLEFLKTYLLTESEELSEQNTKLLVDIGEKSFQILPRLTENGNLSDYARASGREIMTSMGTLIGATLANPKLSFENFKSLLLDTKVLNGNNYQGPEFSILWDNLLLAKQITFDMFETALAYNPAGGEGYAGQKFRERVNYIQETVPQYLERMGSSEKEFSIYLGVPLENDQLSGRYTYLKDTLARGEEFKDLASGNARPQKLVPSSLRSEQWATGIEAYYDTEANRLVFVEDNIRTEDRAKQLFFHEATHGNLAYLETTEKGKKELSQILNSARDQLMAMADDLAAQTGFESLDQLKLAYDFQDETELLSELLARYSEGLVYATEPSWFSKLMSDLILWFKRNFNLALGENDIKNWLAGRMQRAARGERLAEVRAEQMAVGPASIVRKLTASVDPMETRALRRALQGVPEDVAKVLRARTYIPDENPENLRKANEFVDNNTIGDDVYRAKLAAKDQGLKGPVNILVYGVIGKRLKDAIFAIDQRIKAEGNSPELAALREKYSSELYEVLSDAQDILSETGQDLQAARVFANLFSPEEMVRVYTKPIRDVQKKLLEANEEVQRLKALIKTLKEELAAESLKRGIRVAVPETPETKFYEFLSLFGDMEPLENETFGEYLKRLGVDYSALLTELEKPITASVDPKTNENPISGNFRDLDAREAIRRLVGIDKNFFSKLVALRVRTGTFATSEQVGQTQEAKRKSKVSRENRAIELQMVFDFFNTTEASTPATEEPIEKDSLPVMARLAKYAADAVTDRVLRSLGVDKKTTPRGIFDALERQVRSYVNAQFSNTLNPRNESIEDTRTTEQKILDLVERIELSEQIFNDTKANLQARLDEDTRLRERKLEGQMSDADRAALQAAVNRTFDAGKITARANQFKGLIDFKAEARKHMTQRGVSIQSLERLVREKLPSLNDAQVKTLVTLIKANYDRLVRESGKNQLNNLLKKVLTKEVREGRGKSKAEKVKKRIDRLIELINLGALDEAKYYNAIADAYDLPAWDEEVVAEIRKRADNVDRLPQGSDQRNVSALDLQAFIAKKLQDQARGAKKIGIRMDIMASLWKAGVLSGPPTQVVNLSSTFGNVALELVFDAIGKTLDQITSGNMSVNPFVYFVDILWTYWDNLLRVAPREAMDTFLTGYGRLRTETQRQVIPLEAYSIDTKFPKGKGLVAQIKWPLKNVFALYKLVGRGMAATDTFNANLANEAKLRLEARYTLLNDKKLTDQQAKEEMKRLFEANGDMVSGVRDQVEAEAKAGQFGTTEGLDPKSVAYKLQVQKIEAGKRRRFAQLRERQIAEETFGKNTAQERLEDVQQFTKVATFNNDPVGLIGWIGDQLAILGAKASILAPLLSFTRTVANIVNAGLNYTPYGFARAFGWSFGNFFFQDTKHEFATPDSQEFYKLAAQATVGTTLTISLAYLMMQDAEEPWDKAKFAVTGLGPTDPNKREQLRASGWAENSVKIQTPMGPLQFRHTDIPGLSLIFGVLGQFSDAYRYGTLSEKDKVTLAAYCAMSLGNVVFEKNLLTGMRSFFDLLKLREDPVEAMQRMAKSYVGGFTNPGALKWLAETVGVNERGMVEKVDYRKLNSTVDGFLIGLTPAAVFAGEPKLNRLGEPVEEYPWAATTRRVGYFPEVKPHPVLSPLTGAGLFVPGISRLTTINVYRKGKREQVRVDVTEETYYRYAKYNGQFLRRILTPEKAKALAARAQYDKEGAQEELEDMAARARRYGVNRIQAEGVKGLK